MFRFRTAALAALFVPLLLLNACAGGSSGGVLPTAQHAGGMPALTGGTTPQANGQLPVSVNCPSTTLPPGAARSGIHTPPVQRLGGRPAALTGATAIPARPGCNSAASGPTPRSASPMAWSGCSGNTTDYGCGGSSSCSGQTVVVPLSVGRSTEAAAVDTSGCVWYPAECGYLGPPADGIEGGCQPGYWGPPPGSCALLGLPSNCNPGAGGGISPCSPTCKPGPGGPSKKNVTDAHKIWNLALYMYEHQWSSADGPEGGALACAYMVNKILKDTIDRTFGNYPNRVPSVERALKAAGYEVSQTTSGMEGDIDVQGHDGHMGICANAGCTLVFSNSTKYSCFCNETVPTFSGTGWTYSANTKPRFYHIP